MMRRTLTLLMITMLIISFLPLTLARAVSTPSPTKVVIAGMMQSELGCSGDWQPDCDKTALKYDEQSDVRMGTFEVQPRNDQDNKGPRYKVALNGSWTENYGQRAQAERISHWSSINLPW